MSILISVIKLEISILKYLDFDLKVIVSFIKRVGHQHHVAL